MKKKPLIKIAKYGAGLRSTVKARDFVMMLTFVPYFEKKIINSHGFKLTPLLALIWLFYLKLRF